MENFFNWITKPITEEEVEIWFNMNNIVLERAELYFDFSYSLVKLIKETYLGEDTQRNETKILLTEEDKKNHFDWCWTTTVKNFQKENINFNLKGEHYDYFSTFLTEIFYNQKNELVKNSIETFLSDLFDREIPFTKSDLDMMSQIYKLLDKSLKS